MDLIRPARRWALGRPRVLLVAAPGERQARWAIEAELDRRGWSRALSPADTDLLLLVGHPGPQLSEAVELVWSQVPWPRHRMSWDGDGDLRGALDCAGRELVEVAERGSDDALDRPDPVTLLFARVDDSAAHAGTEGSRHGTDQGEHAGMNDGGMDHAKHASADEHERMDHSQHHGHREHGRHGQHGKHVHHAAHGQQGDDQHASRRDHGGMDHSQHGGHGEHGGHGQRGEHAEHAPHAAEVEQGGDQDTSDREHGGMDHGGMDDGGMDHGGMDHGGMDHGGMDHGGMDHSHHAGHGEHGHGGMDHSGHGGMDVAGLPMAETAPDRDGLELDQLKVSLGPVLPGWPVGLVLQGWLQGDVLTGIALRWLDEADSRSDLPAGEEASPRFALDVLADFLLVAGWPRAARAARWARDGMGSTDPVEIEAARGGGARLARRVARSRALAWNLRGLGRLRGADGRGTDLLDRVRGWCAMVAGGSTSGIPTYSLTDLAVQLEGAELGAVRLVVASLGLTPATSRFREAVGV